MNMSETDERGRMEIRQNSSRASDFLRDAVVDLTGSTAEQVEHKRESANDLYNRGYRAGYRDGYRDGYTDRRGEDIKSVCRTEAILHTTGTDSIITRKRPRSASPYVAQKVTNLLAADEFRPASDAENGLARGGAGRGRSRVQPAWMTAASYHPINANHDSATEAGNNNDRDKNVVSPVRMNTNSSNNRAPLPPLPPQPPPPPQVSPPPPQCRNGIGRGRGSCLPAWMTHS